MAGSNPERYEELIAALTAYINTLEEQCGVIDAAAEDCIDNMKNDELAIAAARKAHECVKNVLSTRETIQGVINGLQIELNEIYDTIERHKDLYED